MKFFKGMIVGTIMSAGIAMVYSESMSSGKRKIIRKGKQFIKKMGMI